MQGLVLDRPGVVRLADLPDPTVRADTDAVVRVTRAGLCGSDLHPFTGAEPAATGVACGHEAVGIVEAVGGAVRQFKPGDRVLVAFSTSCGRCRACEAGLTSRCLRGQLLGWAPPDTPEEGLAGCQADLVRVPLADTTMVALPAGIDQDTGVLLADNMPTAWHAVLQTGTVTYLDLAVVGLGAVGLCAVASALTMGARQVLAVDPVEGRRAAAESLGATAVHPDDVGADVVDAVVEAAGPKSAQALAARLVRPGGTVSIIAVQTARKLGIAPVIAYDKNLTLRLGRAPVRAVLDRLLPHVADGSVTVPTSTVITHPGQPLADGPDLYQRFADREPGLVKATFDLT